MNIWPSLRQTCFVVAGFLLGTQALAAQYWHGNASGVRWHPLGDNRAYIIADPMIQPELTAHSKKMDRGIFVVGDKTFVAYGFALSSTTFVVGDTGVLVIDPPEDVHKGEEMLAAFREYDPTPIAAIVYSHSHMDHYGGVRAFASNEDVASGRIEIIAHASFMDTLLATKTLGTGPIVAARASYSLGHFLDLGPDGRINTGIGPDFEVEHMSLFQPTLTFDTTLERNIGGLNVEFVWVPSESYDEIAVWIPELGLLHSAEVLQGESFPNLHTIRGTKYRDPQRWFQSLDRLRQYPAQYLVLSHGRPVSGAEPVAEVLQSYRDAIQYVYDQTLKYMNQGLLPDQLVDKVNLPLALASHPFLGDFYGGVEHSVRQIYVGELGWFQGDPTFLAPKQRVDASRRYLALMGGVKQVVKEAQSATALGDNQWSAELLTHVLRIEPDNRDARLLKASNLRQLAYAKTNINWRNWYLTSALELEGNLDRSRLMSFNAPDLVAAYPSAALLGGLRFRVNAQSVVADAYEASLTVTVSDDNSKHLLVLRQGVLSMSEPEGMQSDMAITVSRSELLQLSRAKSVMPALNTAGYSIERGSEEDVKIFFSYIDDKTAGGVSLTLQ
jgi:alkyl sulfatase BDS1-like metallo-beta-lactamase superfamily hydrolase